MRKRLVNSGSGLGFSLTWAAMSTSWGSLRYLPSPSFKKSSKLPERERQREKIFLPSKIWKHTIIDRI